ncbi:MAG TPA: MBL fold metallo-hydrolase [Pseudolabrys sp.]|nr:MBL fold metallo-hydrolase [Pseudolabrys sp.]
MPAFICTACGTQYPPSDQPPPQCPICEEERQYVPPGGQSWTTLASLSARAMNAWREYEPGITGIGTQPSFGIGQRALLLRTPRGNILWDCIALIDDATVSAIRALGGLKAIAISHPHFYTSMNEWAQAFDAPIYLHAADQAWIMNRGEHVTLWDGERKELGGGVTLIRCGGHFPGGTVLHWMKEGRGVVCSGDVLSVTTDRKFVSFMRSYPNFLPLSAREVEGVAAAMAPYAYETIYGHYFDRVIPTDAKAVMARSVERYLKAVAGTARPYGT